jgi:hypothetical protein
MFINTKTSKEKKNILPKGMRNPSDKHEQNTKIKKNNNK